MELTEAAAVTLEIRTIHKPTDLIYSLQAQRDPFLGDKRSRYREHFLGSYSPYLSLWFSDLSLLQSPRSRVGLPATVAGSVGLGQVWESAHRSS